MWKVKARPRGKRHSKSQEVKEEENGRGKQVRLARRGYRGRPRPRSWKMGTVGARDSSLAISRAEMPQRRAKLKVAASASTSSASHPPRARSSQRGLYCFALHLSESRVRWGCFAFSAANSAVSATPVRKDKEVAGTTMEGLNVELRGFDEWNQRWKASQKFSADKRRRRSNELSEWRNGAPNSTPGRAVSTCQHGCGQDSQQQLLRRGGRVGEQNTKQPGL
ncbi:hypothetical protein NOF04DRAFT_5604 [Fusarium oxysporum II5]|uniref:Uncharacterized protein n=2 Tax=Fusarium oxysporum species complex TaxID=171631 RepID=X0JRE4_FUSO5|nr:uncharacterized protein FOIG_08922 [Fusarium odoratissimum NRRL 54006]EXL99021.1 hypothetical protein FOIG_08922 [Fusarium odoratissimum NRRL 54006]KAK2130279.1 hypothetical protein NOF04DRAFT_5604 [Fusarium oxysporum II5]TXC00865.1 hypothetical protein FocTR4_00009208 [Fusarium oxysporum f. sp. cubense]